MTSVIATAVSTDDLLSSLRCSWIDGAEVADGNAAIAHRNPANGADLGDTVAADAAVVDRAAASARACYTNVWGRLSPAERRAHLEAFADQIDAHRDELTVLETLEVGRPRANAWAVNGTASALVRKYATLAELVHGDLFRGEDNRLGVVWRRSRGVVGAITPWNVPVMNVLLRVAPALAAGNTIVVKPSEYSPRSALLLAKLAAKAGLPDGAFNVVNGFGREAGHALARHPDVNLVAFTGSTRTGQAIAQAAAESSLKPLLLECGGKSPQVVLEDMLDDDSIWDHVFFAGMWNTGQWCVAKTRLLVPRKGLDRAIAGLRDAASKWTIGDPSNMETRMGPLANRTQFDTVARYLDWVRTNAELMELECTKKDMHPDGCYVSPCLVLGSTPDSRINQEEVFGPVMSILPFDDIDDAIRIANNTSFGLSGSAWTRRSDLAYRLARGIQAGGLSIYSSAEAAAQAGPELGTSRYFEPQKQSGLGVDGGEPGFLAYSMAQSVSFFN